MNRKGATKHVQLVTALIAGAIITLGMEAGISNHVLTMAERVGFLEGVQAGVA